MKSKVGQGTWIQCQSCGHIYLIADNVPIEKSIIKSVCPACDYHVGLNCGDKREDIVIYMDPYLDDRYFKY